MTARTSPEARLAELGVALPKLPDPPVGTYVYATQAQGVIYLAGHPPFRPEGGVVQGRLGETLDAAAGYAAARLAGAAMLASLRNELGSLDRVRRILRVYGVVNATPDFMQHTKVIDGASDLLIDVFGDAGRHARLAVGVSSLPFNIALEVDLVAETAG